MKFSGEMAFLSNFYPADVLLDGILYPTSEHAYQASKSDSVDFKRQVASDPRPITAKRLGKHCNVKLNWDLMKYGVMLNIVGIKFSNPVLAAKLMNTGGINLVETNSWNDLYWGSNENGIGENNLGKILMIVRDNFFAKEKVQSSTSVQ